MRQPTYLIPALMVIFLTTTMGCGGVYQPSRSVNFEIDRDAEIDDDDIRKAFEARPQMPPEAMRLSYYTFDPEISRDLDTTLAGLPGVKSVYRIPPLLVTGQRRFHDSYSYRDSDPEVSVKKLRLLAARAKTDVLVIVDHGYRNAGVNPLVSFNMLIIPVFFMPFIDTVVKGYVETFVIDVRNGYLYGHLIQEDERGNAYTTIYSKKAPEYAKEQWRDLRARFSKDLGKLFTIERSRKPEIPASAPSSEPATTASPAANAPPAASAPPAESASPPAPPAPPVPSASPVPH